MQNLSNPYFLLSVCGIILASAAGLSAQQAKADVSLPADVVALLQEAGNADSDVTRYQLLQEARRSSELYPPVAEDLDRLIRLAGYWATGIRDGQNARDDNYVAFVVRPPALEVGAPLATQGTIIEAVYDVYASRGKLCYLIQRFGYFSRDRALREQMLEQIHEHVQSAHQAFPENIELSLLAGELTTAWPNSYPDHPSAPPWANLQRRSLEGLTDIIHWWIDHRQTPEGHFGTSWGDDVEMWRTWLPSFAAFRDPKIEQALAALGEGVFAQPYMSGGYTRKMVDVEHSSEDTSDVITPMMLINPSAPVWHERAMKIVELARTQWMGQNELGQWQHRTAVFNIDRIDPDPRYAVDTTYHSRLYQPAMLIWQREGDADLTEYFTRWLDTWVDAAMRSERGKPVGLLPTAIRWPDGTVGGLEGPWWNPNVLNGVLYRWPSVVANQMMCNALLLGWAMTDDPKYVEPLTAMAQYRLDLASGALSRSDEPGSLGWAVGSLDRFLPSALARYRLLSGDDRFDQLLANHPSGYMKLRLKGENGAMVRRLEQTSEALSHNMEIYTTLCRAGDRLFAMPQRWFGLSDRLESIPTPDIELLYAMTTGDPDMSLFGSFAAVRWLTQPRDIAALVVQADKQHFEAELFHFGPDPRTMGSELYLLSPGTYQWQLAQGNEILAEGEVERNGKVTRLEFTLPAGQLCTLKVVRIHETAHRLPEITGESDGQ